MLTRLRLKDFKSFRDQEVTLGPTTLLVGANGSGKSNFLDAIRLLQGWVRGYSVVDALRGHSEGGREIWPGIRGGVSEIARAGCTELTIGSSWRRDQNDVGLSLRVDLKVPTQPSGLLSSAHPDWATILGATLRATTSLEVQPARMRDHVPRSITHLGSAGENLSAVVWHLAQDATRKQDLIAWLSELCSPTIVDLEFDVTSLLDEVMLVLVEADGTKVSVRALSDGTLRFLGTVVALLSAKDGDILLIEEIETGLHPARVHLLIDLIEEVTRGGRCQVIATTHSPLALAALSSEGLHNAIVFGRKAGEVGTIMRRLGDLPDFDEVAARSGIDDMFTSRWLERAL